MMMLMLTNMTLNECGKSLMENTTMTTITTTINNTPNDIVTISMMTTTSTMTDVYRRYVLLLIM